MKILTRNFTRKEKILISILALIILAFLYYQFVYTDVSDRISKATREKEDYSSELDVADAKLTQLVKMYKELDEIMKDESAKSMPSYNNGKNITKLFNDVVGDPDRNFVIRFTNAARSGNLVRRTISFQFDATSFEDVASVFEDLTDNEYRCAISDIKYTAKFVWSDVTSQYYTKIRVNASITFYETMVGGTADSELTVTKTTPKTTE